MPSRAINSRNIFQIRYAVILLLVVILFGTIGFSLIEGWSWSDSFYVTVQTLTTVGYGDLPPRTVQGRVFAVLVMLTGIGGVALGASTIVQSVVQSELLSAMGHRRQTKRMRKLHDHFIICGSGRVGAQLTRELMTADESFVVIEKDQERAAEFSQKGVNVLLADATLEETLLEAGVDRARGLATCLPEDADNVYVVLTARDLNPNLRIVSRATQPEAEPKLRRAGASEVIAPTIIAGRRIAVALTKPAVSDFMDSLTNEGLFFEQIVVDDSSELVDCELRATPIRSNLDTVVVSIRRQNGESIFSPQYDCKIMGGDLLIAFGPAEMLVKLRDIARGSS
ncbi:MAG TPA: NAD-binding protein [Pyrinomonadaceae bacterium]|nr:NAD-binding protein [Pyrinomonadaceae bacterium]